MTELSRYATDELVEELDARHATMIVILDKRVDDDRGAVCYRDRGNPFTILGLLTVAMQKQRGKCEAILPETEGREP